MSRQLLPLLGLATLLGACAPDAPDAPVAPAAPAANRTVQQAIIPTQDSRLWAAPAGTMPPSGRGGPTDTCEVEILRERSFTATPPTVTNTGITLTPADPTRDGRFSQSIFVRSGPFAQQTADPDCAGTIVFPAGITVVGASATNAEITFSNASLGIPGLSYNATNQGSEAGEAPVIVVNGDGTTTVTWTASVATTPDADTFRLLIDHGTFFRDASFSVNITAGDSINVGGQFGNDQKSAIVPLGVAECGDSIVSAGEACDDGGILANDGCNETCQIEPNYTCPTEGGACRTVALLVPADNAQLNTPSVAVSGTATAGVPVVVEILQAAVVVGTQNVTATGGVWSASIPVSPDGSYSARATVSTSGGSISRSVFFNLDTAAPAAPVVTAPADGSRTGDNTPTYSGTAEADAAVTVIVDGNTVGTANADFLGDWTLTPATPLAEGSHTVRATAADAANNTSVNSNTNTFTVDTTAPAVPVIATPANGSRTNDSTPTYTGTAEANSAVTIIVDDLTLTTVNADAAGNWSFIAGAALADGPHTVRANAADAVGNTSPASGTNSFTVDTTPPAAPVVVAPADGSRTNDSTPAYTGTAEASSAVTVTVDGNTVGTATADASGNWSFTSATPLADGAHTVRATATDAANNTSVNSNTNSFTVDTTAPAAPVVTAPANGVTTGDNTPTYTGTAEANSAVTVIVDGNTVGTATANASGNWSFTPATALADGPHTVRATATDAANNTSVASATNSFTVDATAPAAPVVTAPTNGSRTGDSTPTYTGTAEAGSVVTVNVDGTNIGTTTAAGGSWTLTPAAPLADGAHTVRATATDAAGNTSVNSNTNSFTVDTTPPAAPVVTAPADGSRTGDNTPTYAGTAEANSTVTVIVDGNTVGTATANASGNWTLTPVTALADGARTVRATATDAVNNTSPQSNTNTFTVDTTAPAAPVVTAPLNNAVTNDSTPTYAGTAEANSTVTITVDGSSAGTATANASGNWSFTPATALADGAHTVRATATDAVNNTSPQSAVVNFTVDTVAPVVTITQPAANAAIASQSVTVTATVNDLTATVTVRVDGGAAQPVTIGGAGALSVPLTGLAQGPHTVVFTATDAAGNASTASRTFTVDTVAPVTTLTAPAANALTNDNTPTISGTGEVGSSLVVEVFSAQGALAYTATITIPAGGAWTTTATTLADGNYTIIAIATDAAGNSAGATPRQFTVDATAPVITITQPANNAVTADTTPALQGAVEAGASVLVEVRTSANAVAFTQTVTATAQGWSATSSALVSGAYTVRVVATDAAGNASQPVTSAFTVDTSAPALAITAPVNNSATTDTTPALTGTSDPNAVVNLTVRDAANMIVFQTAATATGAGAWSATSTALVEGAYTLSATTTNLAGTSSSAQVSFSLDLSVQLSIATPGADALLTDATPTIAGSVESGAQVIVTLLDAAGATAFTVTLSPDQFNIWTTSPGAPLADGVYTARVRATDALGNMASVPDFTFTIDTTPPAVAITAPADAAIVGAGPSLEGTAEAGAQVTVTVETAAGVVILSETVTASMTGVWTTSGAAVVAAGDYFITAVAQDLAGNTSMAQRGFTVDLTAAAVAITAPTNGSVVTTPQPTISGTVSGDAALLVELLDAADVVVESAMVPPGLLGDWSYQATTMLPDGMYTARATATRPNNTTATATAAFTIDTIAPALVVITAPADDALLNMQPITVTGTAEPGDMITISVGAQQVGVATADMNGAWTFELPAQADGLIAITAASPTSSADVSVTLDTAAPAVAITAPADGVTVPDGRPTVTGTGEAGALVIITVDGAEAERVTVGPDGMWAWTPADALSVDEHELSVVATDAAGNTSAPVTITITVEAPAPDLEIAILAPTPSALTGASPVISGTATAGAAISVSIDGMVVGTTVAAADGTWSLSLEQLGVTLAEGTHTATATATLGDQTADSSVAFVVDLADPVDPNAGVSLGGDGASCATAPQGRPAPSLLWLGLVGLVGLLRRRRRA